jgi:hypothetical protein
LESPVLIFESKDVEIVVQVCGKVLNFTVLTLLQRSSIPPLSDVLAEIRAQCVQYTSLVLQGVLSEEELPHSSPLLGPVLMVNQSSPRGFLPELVARTHANHELFNKVGNFDLLLSLRILYYQYFNMVYILDCKYVVTSVTYDK